MRRTHILIALIAVALIAAAPAAASARTPTTLTGTVKKVVDGDTIHVTARGFDTVVRLIGIDTPETVHPSKPVQCWGRQASALAKRLLPAGTRVRVVSDPSQDARDRYGRFLGHVYKGRAKGPASINRLLVARGAGKVFVYGGVPFKHVAAFRAAQKTARAKRAGLWGPPCRGNITKPAPGAAPTPTPPPVTAPDPTPTPPAPPSVTSPGPIPPPSSPSCDPNYTGACVPLYPPDVNCSDIRRMVRVVGTDVHKLDSDGNGYGCESYA